MGQFAIVGLSAFGTVVARRLSALGHDVLVVDMDKDMIQDARDWSNRAVQADATDKQNGGKEHQQPLRPFRAGWSLRCSIRRINHREPQF